MNIKTAVTMPFYMDFHQFDSVTIEDVKQAHMADKAVQDQYGVKYHQFWVNEEAGTVFCLTEGPDPETCEACHQEAHGNIPCNIQEVESGYFQLFMGDDLEMDQEDMTLTKSGEVDSGERTLLTVDIRGITTINDVREYKNLVSSIKPKNLAVEFIKNYKGRFVQYSTDDDIIGVFDTPLNALRCAECIQNELLKLAEKHGKNSEWHINFKMGLFHGQPMTRHDGFFEVAIKKAKRLALIAENNQIVLSSNLKSLYNLEIQRTKSMETRDTVKKLSKIEEEFIDNLFEITEDNLRGGTISVGHLSRQIGMSRPQVYRKITSLTGKSPNNFIKDIRLNKALGLIKSGEGNISQIAMEVGYANPAHFTKVFNENFGYPPSKYLSRA